MIKNIINNMIDTAKSLQSDIQSDINDIKLAKHEALLSRNNIKLAKMEQITELKERLNQSLAKAVRENQDINIYRNNINDLEHILHNLYTSNNQLASIILPVKEMYTNIIDEVSNSNGGSLMEIRA